MGGLARIEQGFGCRRSPRLRLGMRARLMTLERTYPVVLEDLAESGARITLPATDDFVVCVLRWMDYQVFADVAWRDGLDVGLRFDKPISARMLQATGDYLAELPIQYPQGEPGPRRSC